MTPLSDRQSDAFDNPAKMACREGNLHVLSEARYLQVVYVPDPGGDSAFVVTAYDLTPKAKRAYRRRQRRKNK
ncbi:MAG TPA: hypothetical protein VGY77_00815 [Gemmataceae bacterium]|jgi:hypothetical protein|nr:hypothetical protein [Gemmataceae bacterium]